MTARQVSYMTQSHLPFMHLLLLIFEPFLMVTHCFSITTSVVSDIRRFDLIEERNNQQSLGVAVKDGDKFIHAEGGRSIVLRENNNGNPRLFNCLHKCWCDFLSTLKLLIIDESVNSSVTESFVEIAGETITRVFPSKAEEHIISERRGPWRRHWNKVSSVLGTVNGIKL